MEGCKYCEMEGLVPGVGAWLSHEFGMLCECTACNESYIIGHKVYTTYTGLIDGQHVFKAKKAFFCPCCGANMRNLCTDCGNHALSNAFFSHADREVELVEVGK